MGQSAHQLASGCPGRQAETSQVQHFFGPGVATLEASFFHWRVAENLEACYRARVWEAFTNSQTWKHASFSYSFFVMFNTSPCKEWLSFLVFLTSFKQLLTHLWHPWHYKSELCLKHHIESLLLYWSSSYRYVKSSLFSFNHWKHNFYKSETCFSLGLFTGVNAFSLCFPDASSLSIYSTVSVIFSQKMLIVNLIWFNLSVYVHMLY